MPGFCRLITTGFILLLAMNAQAEQPSGRQSYESCSLITSQYLTVIQLLGRGFDEEMLQQTLPEITAESSARVAALGELVNNEGLTKTYTRVNVEFARCATAVYQQHGVPESGSREAHFHFCAGENKVRHEVLMAAMLEAPESAVRAQLPETHQSIVSPLYSLYGTDGADAVYDSLASELKLCINSRR
ncbi:hypothetical protein SAMN04487960_109110 [Marinobacter mobilis]|uniref:Uncharacterized protein n=1 Tax=Marinobacter mobilis TaxID=488533 RepID=A0A1H3BPK3_9GAMM|nr:hypothetical protein SAMN04487960_109110 [Marinobacter mobilis]